VGSYVGYTRARIVLAGCESDTANIIAAVVALSQHVFTQFLEFNSLPFALASACRILAESPCFCTVVATQLTLQRCAVSSYIGVHQGEERVDGMRGHEGQRVFGTAVSV